MTTDTEYTWIKQHNYIIDAVRDGAGSTLIAACLHDLEETIRAEERARYAPLVEVATTIDSYGHTVDCFKIGGGEECDCLYDQLHEALAALTHPLERV